MSGQGFGPAADLPVGAGASPARGLVHEFSETAPEGKTHHIAPEIAKSSEEVEI